MATKCVDEESHGNSEIDWEIFDVLCKNLNDVRVFLLITFYAKQILLKKKLQHKRNISCDMKTMHILHFIQYVYLLFIIELGYYSIGFVKHAI